MGVITEIQDFLCSNEETFFTSKAVSLYQKYDQLAEKVNEIIALINDFLYPNVVNNKSLIEDVADKINSSEALEAVLDGGLFTDTTTPTSEFDGGVWS